jgi:hypothetical protein
VQPPAMTSSSAWKHWWFLYFWISEENLEVGWKLWQQESLLKLDKWNTYTTAAAATSNLSGRHNLCHYSWDFIMWHSPMDTQMFATFLITGPLPSPTKQKNSWTCFFTQSISNNFFPVYSVKVSINT